MSTFCKIRNMAIYFADVCCFLLVLQLMAVGPVSSQYVISDVPGLGRRFDGIGGLSGGGATSRLLVNYPEPYQSQILDYLFKPNFAASLPMLKVEIGGDAQSTDGSESSHMHTAADENYQRGYEWWLMKEAKKRNPDLKLYGLPWAFPGWIGNGQQNPYANITVTVDYIIKWIKGAKAHHNLTIDYIGIWNERRHNASYIESLRATLDRTGLSQVQLVAADGKFRISYDILKNPALARAVQIIGATLDNEGLGSRVSLVAADSRRFDHAISRDILKDKDLSDAVKIIGVHYPGTYVTNYTIETGKTIWASEDYSTYNDDVGAGCWARILNQNYVNGLMTCTISWNLIASYYDALPYKRTALMTANEPWSGHYEVTDTIWITAHTTQFTQPGWTYLKHQAGVQHLSKGGSFVSLTDGTNLTIIIETMSHDHSICIRPALPPYTVDKQIAMFNLQGKFSKVSSLNVWYSKLGFNGEPSRMFVKMTPIEVVNGQFTLTLVPDEAYTLTTLARGIKGSYASPPASAPFPTTYSDNFDQYPEFSEASNFADQAGVWEIRESGDPTHRMVLEQVVLQAPIHWCTPLLSPISVIGNSTWQDANVSIDVKLGSDNTGAFLAQRVDKGGCKVSGAKGVFFIVYSNGTFSVFADINRGSRLTTGNVGVKSGVWFNMQLLVQNGKAIGSVNGKTAFSSALPPTQIPSHGFVAIGMPTLASAQFDNFSIVKAT